VTSCLEWWVTLFSLGMEHSDRKRAEMLILLVILVLFLGVGSYPAYQRGGPWIGGGVGGIGFL